MQRLELSITSRSRRRILPIVALAYAVATPAAAGDTKYFNGTFCRVSTPFGAVSIESFADYNLDGSVANTHVAQTMSLVCPIVRDNTTNTDGWDSVEIGYFDKNTQVLPAQFIRCTAFSASFLDGSFNWNPSGDSVDTMGTSWAKNNMVFLDPGSASFNGGYYYIRCTVPPLQDSGAPPSGIAYYRVEEP